MALCLQGSLDEKSQVAFEMVIQIWGKNYPLIGSVVFKISDQPDALCFSIFFHVPLSTSSLILMVSDPPDNILTIFDVCKIIFEQLLFSVFCFNNV